MRELFPSLLEKEPEPVKMHPARETSVRGDPRTGANVWVMVGKVAFLFVPELDDGATPTGDWVLSCTTVTGGIFEIDVAWLVGATMLARAIFRRELANAFGASDDVGRKVACPTCRRILLSNHLPEGEEPKDVLCGPIHVASFDAGELVFRPDGSSAWTKASEEGTVEGTCPERSSTSPLTSSDSTRSRN
jgi:hypothetical protein